MSKDLLCFVSPKKGDQSCCLCFIVEKVCICSPAFHLLPVLDGDPADLGEQ